jgi:hypothetical protein
MNKVIHPRRLKWSALESVPVDKGNLLEVDFIDRQGNQYRWAPEWDKVWLLFLEAIKIELQNYPDGPWAQVFQDLAGLAVARLDAGDEHPRYPELVEKLINMVFVSSYLEEKYPNARTLRKVRLGPTELSFKKLDSLDNSKRRSHAKSSG